MRSTAVCCPNFKTYSLVHLLLFLIILQFLKLFQHHPCSQILTKHNNEARVLQGLLRDTRACRDQLARQLQATENKLRNTEAALQHLQLLSQDHSLLEREELTLKLAQATAQLQEKDKRILVWRGWVECVCVGVQRLIHQSSYLAASVVESPKKQMVTLVI